MNKRIRKMLSWALVLCLLISAVPASVVATEAEQTESIVAPAEQTMSTAAPAGQTITAGTITTEQLPIGEITIVREETSLRGQYEKHFLMSDGSYQAVVYSEPVHKLVDGVWVELDKEDLADASINSDTSTDSTQQNIIDNYVLEGSGVQNSNLNRLYIGNKSGSIARAFIQFAVMPTIPQGATITAATMTLTIYEGTSTANNASAYMVTGGEWTSGTISWENMPAAETLLQENISHNNLTKYQFSCLTAVQHWYDGDITGQNENYGVMIRYYDETIADYNSVFSADHTVATSRPSLRISYNPQVLYIEEGFSCTLTSPNVTGEIVWESSNTAVATVTSVGRATSVKAGSATITASVDGTVVKAYTIYVIKPSGVYYINNRANYYLGTCGYVADGTKVILQEKETSGRAQLNQLWRIDHLEKCYYSIRPMYKMDMGMTCENGVPGPVEITTIGTDSASIPLVNKWTIEYKNDGYVFRCTGSSVMILCRPQPTLGSQVAAQTGTDSMAECKWNMERVTSVANQVLLLDTQSGDSAEGATYYINPGETLTPEEVGITASVVCSHNLSQYIEWKSSAESVISIDPTTGQMTGMQPGGSATITARHNFNGSYAEAYVTIVVLPVMEGIYLVRNKRSDKYLDIWNGSMQNGSQIVQWGLDADNTQKWEFTYLGDGLYSIKSVNSITPYYLGVSGDSTANEQSVVLRTGSLSNGMKWRVVALESGGYKIVPLTGESNNRVLSTEVNPYGSSNGDIVYQRNYSDDTNYEDEWYLCREKDYSLLYRGAYEDDPAMPPILTEVQTALMNDANMSGYASTTMTRMDVMEQMVSSEIFSCITHGGQMLIVTSDGTFTVNDVNSLPDSAFDNLKLVCLTACLTGSGGSAQTNLVNTLYNKGVDTVIGFKVNIGVEEADIWTKVFMISIADGKTIAEAMTVADTEVRDYYSNDSDYEYTVLEDNRYVVGSTNVVICSE